MFRDSWIMDGHQADRLRQERVRPRFTDLLMVEDPPVERLMLRPYSREQVIGLEVSGGHPAKPRCNVGQSAMDPRKLLIGGKAGWIDKDFPSIEFRLQNIRKDFERGTDWIFLRGDVKAD